jgi:hypothetical protein
VNWHDVIDERSLELHRVVADVLRRDPSKLTLVSDWIHRFLNDPAYSDRNKDGLKDWNRLIREQGLPGVLAALEDPSENGRRLRHCSPFAVLMPQDERRRILTRYETRRSRAHPAGV